MATRAYRRDSKGRFAGSGGGTHVTYGKAGGFKKGNRAAAGRRGPVSGAKSGPKSRPKNSLSPGSAKAKAGGQKAKKSLLNRYTTAFKKHPKTVGFATYVVGINTARAAYGVGKFGVAASRYGVEKAAYNRIMTRNAQRIAPKALASKAFEMKRSRKRIGGAYKITAL